MERKSLKDISWQVIPSLENYAASDTGDINPSMTCHIGDVCNNKRNTCYGYK